MAFRSYLTRSYEFTHENSFFRAFSTQLRTAFRETEGLHILIGNLSCNGHQIDALYVSSGKIIVIDFKNYGGTLTFSENNPWRMAQGGDFVFVKGGNNIRNPYQQVNAYRHSLRQYLSDRQAEFLAPNHGNFNPGHISGLVLFHQPITFDSNEIPSNIKLYFDVADNNNCVETIKDRTSAQLNMADPEIEGMLRVLDISAENLYDEAGEPAFVAQPVNNANAARRLELVQSLLAGVTATTEIEKLLTYYQTLITLERKKEPKVLDEHLFAFDWTNVTDTVAINIENNGLFHQNYQQNRQAQYPKSLFIGLNVLFGEQILTLLHTVIPNGDILTHTNVECRIRDFTLYTKPLEDRNYPDELIELLATALNQTTSIGEKIEVLSEHLNGAVQLADRITVAFSEENASTVQLLSELKKMSQVNLQNSNSLLERFLTKKPIYNPQVQIAPLEFIQISPLNASQKDAVRSAFNQPLSVITGPPGTGKTQVVLNILANAIVQNKKVLLASKNNQAVDNVKDRLATIIKEPDFFLRFGSKNAVREKTVPAIETFITRIHGNSISDNNEALSAIQDQLNENKTTISRALAKIKRRKNLELEVPQLKVNIERKAKEFQDWMAAHNDEVNVYSSYSSEEFKSIILENNRSKNEVAAKYSGFWKFIFDWTGRKKYAVALATSFESWSPDLRRIAKRQGIEVNLTDLKNGQAIIATHAVLVRFIESAMLLLETKTVFERAIENQKANLQSVLSEIEQMKASESESRQTIKECLQKLDNLGIPLVNELIYDRLLHADVLELSRFANCVPDNIPWRYEDIRDFVQTTRKFLDTFNITAVTNLSIKTAFPLATQLYDLVVIDEASQCDVASVLPLIYRAKQLVVIGDPMQLKHITNVQLYEERYIIETLGINGDLQLNYVNKSLYDYCFDLSIISGSRSVFLKEHFRCHPQIIGYSNRAFYVPRMGQELDIKTSPQNYLLEPKGIYWVNAVGEHEPDRNVNRIEINTAIDLACRLAAQHQNISIGITTPFTHQAKALNDAIPQSLRERIKADTVHKFQGEEKDMMILSLVVSQNSPPRKAQWINDKVPYLINVAVSRARNTLFVVGNANYHRGLPGNSPLGALVRYIDEINPTMYGGNQANGI